MIELIKIIALAAALLLVASIEQTQAQNNWSLTGSSSSSGGFVIVGNSTLNLGDLSTSSTPVFLSANGGDTITLQAGSFLNSSSAYPLEITTNNNHFTNFGSISGSTNEALSVFGMGNFVVNESGGSIFGISYAVDMEGNNQTLINNGTITSNYDAVYLSGSNVTFTNNNTVIGSSYGVFASTEFLVLNNNASITSDDYAVYLDEASNTVNNNSAGFIGGSSYGVYVASNNNTINNRGTITGTSEAGIYVNDQYNTINNWGKISSNVYGIQIEDNNNTVNNYGTVSGGDQGLYLGDSYNTVNNWGTLTGTNAGMESNEPYNTTNNYGTISGQTYGFYLNDSHNVLNNWGTISAVAAGTAAVWFTSGYHDDTINNWGLINPNGAPYGIVMQSSNDTLNLNGHSTVFGKILITGVNDYVELNFSGLSPATIASLNASLKAQGVDSGTATSAAFTLRGVHYNIDPALIYFNATSYQLQGRTPNQQAVGAALDSVAYNPLPGTSLFNLFNSLDTSGNIPGALDQLSPQAYAALGDIAISQANFVVQSIDSRLNNIRNGSESVDTTGIGGSSSGITSGLSKNDGKSSKEIQPAANPTPDRWGFFATGDGLFFRGSHSDVSPQDARANSAGSLVGVDGKVGENGVVGALFAYNSTSAELNGSAGHADIESYSGGLYGSWHEGGYYVNGLAAYTRNNYDLNRNITLPGFFGNASANPNGDEATANIDGGYDWNASDRIAVGPMLGLQYVHLNIDSFGESGAGGADLNVNSQDISSLQSRLGVHANYHLATTQTSSFALDLHAAWQHEYLNDSRSIGASFAAIPTGPFNTQTASPLRDAGIVGIGLNFTFKNRLALFTEYELEMWSASYFSQSINGGARISF